MQSIKFFFSLGWVCKARCFLRLFLGFYMSLFLATILTFTSFLSQAAKVHSVHIRGNHHIEKSLILSHLSTKPPRRYRSYLVKKDVKKLTTLGFFDKVEARIKKLSTGKIRVTYLVKERPIIDSVVFKGNEKISTEDLEELLTVKLFQFINFDDVENTLHAIQKTYKEKGYFLTEVSYKIKKLKNTSRVQLQILIDEKYKTLIKKINLIGNRSLKSREIKKFMLTKEQNILSWFTNSGVYDPEIFERDIQMISYLYRDRGYLQLRLERPELSITPDKKGVYITVMINEGPRFRLGQVEFQEDSLFSREDVIPNLELRETPFFSLSVLQKDLQYIQTLYKNKGYAFAEVSPQMFPDNVEEDKIHILFKVKPGKRYKVGRIDLVGNRKTRDKVILRELRIEEGDFYQESKKNLSQSLIQRLGFFEQVQFKIIKKSLDRLDLLIDLKEREKVGEAHIAGGYNSFSKLFIKGGIKNNNFLGLGQSLSVQLDLSRFQELFNFNYTNPYFFDTPWSFSLDVFNMGQDMINGRSSFIGSSSSQIFSYSQLNTGFSLALGRRFSDYISGSLKYQLRRQSLSNESIHLMRKIPGLKTVFEFLFGKEAPRNNLQNTRLSQQRSLYFTDIYSLKDGEGVNSSLSGIVEYDGRNDRLRPSSGLYGYLSLEYAGLGGDFFYKKARGTLRYYKKLFSNIVWKNNLNYGLIFSGDPDRRLPFTELFLLGGPDSLRGFQLRTVGKKRYSRQAFEYAQKNQLAYPDKFAMRPYGGSTMFYYNLELEYPLFKQAQISAILFFDIGEANDKLSLSLEEGLRMDAGVGFRWWSPFGPIRVDIGLPYKPRKEYGEKTIEFQFNVGSSF